MLNSSLYFPHTPSVACTQLKKAGKESSLALFNETTTETTSPSSLQSSTELSQPTQGGPDPNSHPLASPSRGSSCDATAGSRKSRRVGMLGKNWSTIVPSSRSLEALIERTKATLTGKGGGGQNSPSREVPKVQRIFSAKTLPKSFSQGSVSNSPGGGLHRVASQLLPGPTAPRLDADSWRYRGPLSQCFLRRKRATDGSGEVCSFSTLPVSCQAKSKQKASHKAEQGNKAAPVKDMSLAARLAYINAMKGKTYSLHTGFALARKDALDMIGVLQSSTGHKKQVVQEADTETFSQLLLMQAKVLSSSCRQMAEEYGSPEELLLTLTHSFHTLCCLTQACMSLVEGLSTERERRELLAKVDEIVVTYVSLLKAAEAASGSSPTDQSVNALTHHSATMSAIITALIHSLQTLLNK